VKARRLHVSAGGSLGLSWTQGVYQPSPTYANQRASPQNVGTIRTAAGTVGCMLFNDHIATAERALVNAFRQLSDAKIAELVLDVRDSGGE